MSDEKKRKSQNHPLFKILSQIKKLWDSEIAVRDERRLKTCDY